MRSRARTSILITMRTATTSPSASSSRWWSRSDNSAPFSYLRLSWSLHSATITGLLRKLCIGEAGEGRTIGDENVSGNFGAGVVLGRYRLYRCTARQMAIKLSFLLIPLFLFFFVILECFTAK